MTDASDVRDPYEVLQLPKGADSSEQEITKAYRTLARQTHPDKNRNNPNAAKLFIEVQQAYDIAMDPKAREAWMQLQKAKQAREARWSGQSAKRQKMMAELNRKEAAAAQERSQEDQARSRLQAELARLAKQHAERAAAMAKNVLADLVQAPAQEATGAAAGLSETDLMRTVKASWERRGGEYSAQQLREAFSVHGEVTDVALVQAKKKTKGSALIQFAALQPALAAAEAAHGRPENPIKVTPFVRAMGDPAAQALAGNPPPLAAASAAGASSSSPYQSPMRSAPPFPFHPTAQGPLGGSEASPGPGPSGPGRPQTPLGPEPSSFPGPQVPVFGSGNRDFESLTLMRMRQKAERDRMAAELLQQDADKG